MRRIAMLGAAWLVCVLAAGLALGDEYGRVPQLFVEAPIWLLFVLLIAVAPGFRRILSDIGGRRAGIVLTFPALMIVGQVISNQNRSYPFPPWAMYGEVVPADNFTEYQLELASGRRIGYPFEAVAPAGFPRAFKERFRRSLLRQQDPTLSPAARQQAQTVAQTDLQHLIGLYERRFPGDRVRSISVGLATIPMAAFRNRDSIVRRELARLVRP